MSSPTPFSQDEDKAGAHISEYSLLIPIVAICGAVVLLLGSAAGFVVGRRCIRKRNLEPIPEDNVSCEQVVAAKEKVDQEVGDNASTATPHTVDSEVQTEVSGDIVAEQTETFSVSDEVKAGPI